LTNTLAYYGAKSVTVHPHDMFFIINVVKMGTNNINSTTSESGEKINTNLDSLEFAKNFDVCFKTNKWCALGPIL
jgi:hypothetical protein